MNTTKIGASSPSARLAQRGWEALALEDPELAGLIDRELVRQTEVLTMVAASSIAPPGVIAAEGSAAINVTTEGYPAKRFHAGCEVIDDIERLAVARAKTLFGAQYANVQPHSGSTANAVVLFSLMNPGDVLLGMDLDSGGHLTHGSKASVMGNYFNSVGYGLTEDGFIDYDGVLALAKEHRPKVIICGASAYPRTIDFARFREIADEVGAYLLADISHISGLVVGGVHPSPIDHAHVTTTSTYKQLYGPRGGLILCGRDSETAGPDGKKSLADLMQRGCFPFVQGTPNLAAVAAKAAAFKYLESDEFKSLAQGILDSAALIAEEFVSRGYRVLTGGTDNHMVVIDVASRGVTGVIAEKALEACNVVINKNRIVNDTRSAYVTSGIRLGTNSLVARGMGSSAVSECSELVHTVLSQIDVVNDREFNLDEGLQSEVQSAVRDICKRYPLSGYGELS